MGALPNVTPITRPASKRPPKAPRPATDLQPVPRERGAILLEFCGSDSAWTPFTRRFAVDRWRLASGGTFYALTDFLVHECGRHRKPNAPLSLECEVSIPELALAIGCNERSINRELLYMSQRDMAIVMRLAGGRALVRLVLTPEMVGDKEYPGWTTIEQAYCDWAAAQRQSLDEQAEELEAEEDNFATKDPTRVELKPQRVKRGARSPRAKVEAFVKSMRVQVEKDSPVDIQFSGEVVSGELVLSVCGGEIENARSKNDAKRAESTTSDKTSGRTCPNGAKLPPNAGSQNHPQIGGITRSEEIAAIFDPLLLKSCRKTLSADLVALRKACAAVADTDHDYLIYQVMQRAARPIASPLHCEAICREIAANWKRSKALGDVIKKLPTRAEIDEMIAEERAARKRGKK